MVSYGDAFCIACEMADQNGFGSIDAAAKASDGWLFYVEQRVDSEGLLEPGGPWPIFVSASGAAREVSLPSDDGFAILDGIVEEDIPLPFERKELR